MADKVNLPEVLTLKETAELLKLRPEKVYLLAENGKLSGAKVGGRWRFVRKEILHWMRKGIIIPMKKRTKKFFSQELPLICMLLVALFIVFESSELVPVAAEQLPVGAHRLPGRVEESRHLREISEKETLRESEYFGNNPLKGEGEHPWWEFPGWETVLAIIGCLYFIFAKYLFQHFLTK